MTINGNFFTRRFTKNPSAHTLQVMLVKGGYSLNALIKHLVNQKINGLTSEELMKFGKKYGFKISRKDAETIINLLHARGGFDVFQEKERRALLKEIAQKTNADLSQSMEGLFQRLIKWMGN